VLFEECQEVGFNYRDRHPGDRPRGSLPHFEAARNTVVVLSLFDGMTADGQPRRVERAPQFSA
jgi:hypothetical protein